MDNLKYKCQPYREPNHPGRLQAIFKLSSLPTMKIEKGTLPQRPPSYALIDGLHSMIGVSFKTFSLFNKFRAEVNSL